MSPANAHHWISPSKLGRLVPERCPGSAKAERGLPELPGTAEQTSEGGEGHDWLEKIIDDVRAGDDLLSAATKKRIKNHRVRFLVDRCLDWLRTNFEAELDTYDIHTEMRLPIKDRTGREMLFGTADVVLIPPPGAGHCHAVVIDWKFYHEPLDPIDARLQVTAYLVGVMQKARLKRGRGFLYLPRLDRQYEVEVDLDTALGEIESIVAGAESERLRAGPWCRYCRAQTTCGELRSGAAELSFFIPEEAKKPKEIGEAMRLKLEGLLEREDYKSIKRLVEMSYVVEPALKAAKAQLKEFIEAGYGEHFPEYELREKTTRTATDIDGIYERLSGQLSDSEIVRALKVKWSDLEDVYVERATREALERGHKLPKAQAKELVKQALKGLIHYGTTTELRRRKG